MLTITGHGESRVEPDQVMISLGVTTEAKTAAEAMSSNSTRQEAVLETLEGAGVDASDIQTSGLTLNPMMNYPEDGTAPTINGYMAQNLLTVRVTEIDRTGEVLDSIVNAGANEMQGIRFIREDSQATEDDALNQAVSDAAHRATVMAQAAGLELGPIIRMGEPKSDMVGPEPVMLRAMDAAGGQAKSIPVEGGEVAFTADVEVTYALQGGEACAMPEHETQGGGAQGTAPESTDSTMPSADPSAPEADAAGAADEAMPGEPTTEIGDDAAPAN
ncbi:SIMPL domain-containing protein [Paracoccus aurantiacus]|nr:SIMPL domain-containing protein [Paracoccus aurantiacus]